jgi:hypothetical protein
MKGEAAGKDREKHARAAATHTGGTSSMTRLTTYKVTLRTETSRASTRIRAVSAQAALAEARAIADDDERLLVLDFEQYPEDPLIHDIVVRALDGECVAEWLSPELLMRIAAEDLFNALEKALAALNTARCFKVPKLGTDSYAIAAQCGRALDKARGKELEPAQPSGASSAGLANLLTHQQLTIIERLIAKTEQMQQTADVQDSIRNEPTLAADARRMFGLPLSAILPDGTRTAAWDERLRAVGAVPVYSKTEAAG